MKRLRHSHLGALPPNPRDFPLCRQNGFWGSGLRRPRPIPAAESALGLRPRIALSSAQVLPEWTTSTSPCNDFSANGDYPLNFVSHSRVHFTNMEFYPYQDARSEVRNGIG